MFTTEKMLMENFVVQYLQLYYKNWFILWSLTDCLYFSSTLARNVRNWIAVSCVTKAYWGAVLMSKSHKERVEMSIFKKIITAHVV